MIEKLKQKKHMEWLLAIILVLVLALSAVLISGCGEEKTTEAETETEETEPDDGKEHPTEEFASVPTFIPERETEPETESEEPTEPPTWQESEKKGQTALAKCYTFVNVRSGPAVSFNIIGKVYNNCAATILDEIEMDDGLWYLMTSGNCSGFIKAEYFITGEAADAQKEKVGKKIGVVKEDYLRIRSTPDLKNNDNVFDHYRINTEVVI